MEQATRAAWLYNPPILATSDWVGVIGTAVGAGIGGVVTVASLVVKGRQDVAAERRRHDREDQLRAVELEREDQLRAVELSRLEFAEHVQTPALLYARVSQELEDIMREMSDVEIVGRPPLRVDPVRVRVERLGELVNQTGLVVRDPKAAAAGAKLMAVIHEWLIRHLELSRHGPGREVGPLEDVSPLIRLREDVQHQAFQLILAFRSELEPPSADPDLGEIDAEDVPGSSGDA